MTSRPAGRRRTGGQSIGLYDRLLGVWPSPVVALNRAVAVRFGNGPAAGFAALDDLQPPPARASYPYVAAARAECLAELDRTGAARELYKQAIASTDNLVERRFLGDRLSRLAD